MSNKTVYPFGTDGQLPSSIGIINDLATGGADKALSAEMGKELNGTTVVTGTFNLASYSQVAFIISNTNVWAAQGNTAGKCVFIPISGIAKVSVEISGGNGVIAFLKDSTLADHGTPNFSATYPSRIQIADGGSEEYDVPADAMYLYVQTAVTAGDDIRSRYAISYERITSTIARKSDIENLQEQIDEINGGKLAGKKIAVIGDSISTIYGFDTPYWTVKSVDVGNTIQSYVTWQDVYGNYQYPDRTHPTGKSIGGVTLTEAMIDGELHSFTPIAEDAGKEIGVPRHYSGNTASVKVWSERLCESTGATLLANASWSGSAITSALIEKDGLGKVASQSWHPCTIGRCRVRDDDGNFVNPDIIIIYRGTNDLSYANNGNYPTMQISEVDLMDGFSATTDKVADHTYDFRTGYYMAIQALRTAYPNAIIILCTLNVFKRVIYNKWPTRNNGFTLPDINNAIREIADVTGCPVIEFDKDGITFQNCYPTYISDDATTPTHPNNNGHRVMGEKAISDLRYSLNPTE